MTRRWTSAAGQWIRWLMGESKLPGRGQRAAAIPMILVAILAVSGLTAALSTTATGSAPAGYSLESDPPTPPPGSLDPITGANTDTSSSSSSSDSVATTTTPAPTPAPAKAPRVPKERVKTARIAGAARVPKVGRLAKGAASTTPTTSPTPVTTTTTTTTTSPDTGGWA